jgi:hypothetical protein
MHALGALVKFTITGDHFPSRIDAQLSAQLRERSLQSLYCCSDGERGCGAAVTNFSHIASFHSLERIARIHPVKAAVPSPDGYDSALEQLAIFGFLTGLGLGRPSFGRSLEIGRDASN